jgi:hypothetical protein
MNDRTVVIVSIVFASLLVNFLSASALTFTVNSSADDGDTYPDDGEDQQEFVLSVDGVGLDSLANKRIAQ